MLKTGTLSTIFFFAIATVAAAQEEPATTPSTVAAAMPTTQHAIVDSQPHPTIPADSSWAGVMLIIIAGAFLAAAVIGPIVRANTPDEVPPYSHDEPPGSSGHHGASGTANYRHQ